MTPERWRDLKGVLDRAQALESVSARDEYLRSVPEPLQAEAREYLGVDPDALAGLLPTEVGQSTSRSGPARAPVPAPAAAPPEILLGRYRIVRPLGRGGMGTVDLAHDDWLDCPVAIKRLRDVFLPDEEARHRVQQEGRALAALNHPGIARVQDVPDVSPPMLVMEYVDGEPFDAWLRGGPSSQDVLRVLRQIVEAIAYMHRKGVVHCDLKPLNVLVTGEGQAKIVDFGIALRARAGTTTVMTESTRHPAFTPKYAAPEVVRGATPTPASDVYSMGVLIEDALGFGSPQECALPSGLTSTLLGVSLRAKSEVPADRYRDGAALLQALPTEPHTWASRSAHWRTLASTVVVVGAGCVSAGIGMVGDGDGRVSAASMPIMAVVTRVDPASANSLSAVAADFVRQAMAPMKRARLVARSFTARDATHQELAEAFKHEGLSHVLVPSVATMGPRVRVSVAVLRSSDGRLERTVTRFGSEGEMARLCRAVSDELRWWLGEAPPPPRPPAYEPSTLSLAQYSEARRYVERADQAGHLQRARDLLLAVVAREPRFTAAHAQLGRVHYLMYREHADPASITDALESVLQAVQQQPDLPETRIALATIHQARGKRAEAIAELHRVLEIAQENDQALQLLGRLEAADGQVDAGIDLLKRAIELVPSWTNYQALGATYYRAGRYTDAAATFDTVTQLQPDNSWGFQMLGAALHRLGRLDDAAAAYRRSIELNPIPEAWSNLATLEYERGDLVQAAGLYARAIELAPHEPAYARNLGDVQRERGLLPAAHAAYGEAIARAEQLLKVNPDDPGPLGTAAYANARLGQCAKALAFARDAREAARGAPASLGNVVNAYGLCEQFRAARDVVAQLQDAGHAPHPLFERDVVVLLERAGIDLSPGRPGPAR